MSAYQYFCRKCGYERNGLLDHESGIGGYSWSCPKCRSSDIGSRQIVTKDVFGIVANVISDKVLRTGAKVWVCYCNGDASCPRVIGLSKNGRMIQKYTHYKRLENFRAKWIPEHLRSSVAGRFNARWLGGVIWEYETKDEAQRHADSLSAMWTGVRFFHRDGRLLRDGITEEEAFRRARGALHHPVDILKDLGAQLTPGQEAQARAICDETVYVCVPKPPP